MWNLIKAFFRKKRKKRNVIQFKADILRIFQGMEKHEIENIGKEFVNQKLITKIRPGALICMKKYKSIGVPIFLVSGSPSFYIKALSDHFELSGYIATELDYNFNNKYTGKIRGADCIEKEKANRVKELANYSKINLKNSILYSDSIKDLPLFEEVGFPIAVWPDKYLKKICEKRDWNVEYW
jgi:HAD superfamily hydrolase (TIGR01490 family)